MPNITFYKQAREDGGVRTGIEIDGEVVLGRFEKGDDEENPVLAWFIVVECIGDPLPNRPEPARRWLLDHAPEIRGGLETLAELLRAGLDIDSWPQRFFIEGMPEGITVQVTCSAVRRYEGQHFSEILRAISDRWEEGLRSVAAVEEVSLPHGEG